MIRDEKHLSYEEFVLIISESLGIDRDDIDKDTSFIDDLGIDSLSLIDCIIKLEKRFDIKLDISNIWELQNIEKAYEMFTNRIAALKKVSS
ncbi:MAG: acyl carrier protein [Candidatus Pacearchaeota archaeon]|nr:acyl carrier protein [Candidatus Pacearchaeota archaeon]